MGRRKFRPIFINTFMFWNSLKRVSAPSSAPISLEDVKSHLAIAHSDEDSYLTSLINVATAYIDGPNAAGIALMPQLWRATYDRVPSSLSMRFGPVRAIVAIKVGDEAIQPATYSLDADTQILTMASPTTGTTKITFEAGYDAVPEDLLHTIRMIVGHLYANREAVSTVAMHDVPMAVEATLNRYRVHVTV